MEILPIPVDRYNVGFIGAGKMAESIARGAVGSGVVPLSRIRAASHTNPACRQAFESFGVKVLTRNLYVVKDSDVVIFSVKPQVVKGVVSQLRPVLTKNKLLVSVAAGVKLKDLQEWTSHNRFIRVMPNTAAAVGEAASVFSGSGPAYIYLAIEALADGGVAAGLPRDLALSLASQTVLGAASMATSTGKHRGQLKDDVSSPGGTTIAGIHELKKGGFRGILMNCCCCCQAQPRAFLDIDGNFHLN